MKPKRKKHAKKLSKKALGNRSAKRIKIVINGFRRRFGDDTTKTLIRELCAYDFNRKNG